MITPEARENIAGQIGSRTPVPDRHLFGEMLPTFLAESFRISFLDLTALAGKDISLESIVSDQPLYHHQIRNKLSAVSFAVTSETFNDASHQFQFLSIKSDVPQQVDDALDALGDTKHDYPGDVAMIFEPALQLRALWSQGREGKSVAIVHAPTFADALLKAGSAYSAEEFLAGILAIMERLELRPREVPVPALAPIGVDPPKAQRVSIQVS